MTAFPLPMLHWSRLSPRARTTSDAQRDTPTRLTIAVLYAAALYPLVLCFLNTRVARMPNAALIVSELLIAALALPVIAVRLNLGILLVALAIVANFLVLAIVQQQVDIKALRDLLVPVVFVWLGYAIADRRLAERVLRNLAVIAVALGLVEWLVPTFYTSLFDTIAFYTSRGFGGNNPFQLTVLQVRPGGIGRSILPSLLGARRISSFFLEPVALGNFAVLTAAWALAKPKAEWRAAAWLMALATVMIVLADARFGSASILILMAARATQVWRLRIVTATMPILAMTILILVTLFGPPEFHDNLVGRFQISGGNLLYMEWSAWLGLPTSISMDAGYGYIIQRTGIVICALLWFVFSMLPMKDDEGRRFHFNVAAYACLNLTISGSSLFSMKTTAMLWFMLGTVIAHRAVVEKMRVVPASTGVAA